MSSGGQTGAQTGTLSPAKILTERRRGQIQDTLPGPSIKHDRMLTPTGLIIKRYKNQIHVVTNID